MSHTNSTPNYQLPQFVGTDKPAYLTDFNQAFSAIDTGIHAAKTAADTAGTDITELGNEINETNQNLTALGSTVSTLQGTVTSVSQTANQANTKANNLAEKFNLSTLVELGDDDITDVIGGTFNGCEIKIAKNADGSLFKIYGYLHFINVNNSNLSFRINNTSITTDSPYIIQGTVYRRTYNGEIINIGMYRNILTVNNNFMTLSTSNIQLPNTGIDFDFIACLIFNSNFGDNFEE